MPRLKKEVVEARENTARDLFKQGKSPDEVQAALVAGDGMRMAPPRLLAIYKEVTGKDGKVVAPKPETGGNEMRATGTPINAPNPMGPVQFTAAINEVAKTVVPAKQVRFELKPPPVIKKVKCEADCGQEFDYTVPEKPSKNLPVCPNCKSKGIVAVVRRN